MTRLMAVPVMLAWMLVLGCGDKDEDQAKAGEAADTDNQEDVKKAPPLPDGATARLGTPAMRLDEPTRTELAVSADGTRLFVGNFSVFDTKTGARITNRDGFGSDLPAITPDGKTAFVLDQDPSTDKPAIVMLEPATGKVKRTLALGVAPESSRISLAEVALSPDQRRVAAVMRDMPVMIHDVASGKMLLKIGSPDARFAAIQFASADLIAVETDGKLNIWTISGKKKLHTFDVKFAEYFIDTAHQRIAVADTGGASLLDIKTGTEIIKFDPGFPLHAAAFSKDGKTLFTSTEFSRLAATNLETGEVTTLGKTAVAAADIAPSPDGARLYVMPEKHAARILVWDLKANKPVQYGKGHAGVVLKMRFSKDGKQLLSVGGDATARLWDVQSGNQVASYTIPTLSSAQVLDMGTIIGTQESPYHAMGETPVVKCDLEAGTSSVLVSLADVRPTVHVSGSGVMTPMEGEGDYWLVKADLKTKKTVWVSPGLHFGEASFRPKTWFSPDGSLAIMRAGTHVAAIDARSGKPSFALDTCARTSWVAFTQDGGQLAMGDGRGNVSIVDPATGKVKAQNQVAEADSAAWVASDTLVFQNRGGLGRWKVGSKRPLRRNLKGPRLTGMVKSPSGKLIATSHENGIILIWNVEKTFAHADKLFAGEVRQDLCADDPPVTASKAVAPATVGQPFPR